MSQAFQLHQLQIIDSQIDKISLRLQEIEKAIADDTEVKIAEEHRREAQNSQLKLAKQTKSIEDEVEAARIKLDINNSALYGGKIQNPKELKDMQSEVSANNKRLTTLEDSLLSLMIELEEADHCAVAAQTSYDNVLSKRKMGIGKLQDEQKFLIKEIENLSDKKPVVVNSISPDNLTIYTKLRSLKRGLAVASIEDNTCSACGASLTPAERQASRTSTQLVFCLSCGRILYAG
jgi:uncharacterized protein